MNFILALKIIYQEQIQKQTSAVEAIFGVHKFKSFYAYQKNCIDYIIYDKKKKGSAVYKPKSLHETLLCLIS